MGLPERDYEILFAVPLAERTRIVEVPFNVCMVARIRRSIDGFGENQGSLSERLCCGEERGFQNNRSFPRMARIFEKCLGGQ